MSKKLLNFLFLLESHTDRPADQALAQFIRNLFPEGCVVDNSDLTYHLDKLILLAKECKNVAKSKKSNQNQEEF